MWSHDEFEAKAKLYFSRAESSDEGSDEYGVWLLLGLEFLLRAPLAKRSPALLASPEGDSILHAVGIRQATARPRSITMKTVVDRLTKLDPGFGSDRAKDAVYLSDLRNGELHTSEAAISNASLSIWMPKFLAIAEALCVLLGADLADFLSPGVIAHAQAIRDESDRVTRKLVQDLVGTARTFYQNLNAEEVAQRAATAYLLFDEPSVIAPCPACAQESAIIMLAEPGRSTVGILNAEADEISYSVTYVVDKLSCPVCNLKLDGTAHVMAAGLPRLFVKNHSEDRYEGWEERMTYDDAIQFIGGEEGQDYMND